MLVKFERRKPSILVSKGARGAPRSSDPVPIAGDSSGVPGSSDSVSTAERRGDGLNSDVGLFSPARCSPIISSDYTGVSGAGRCTGSWYFVFKSFLEMSDVSHYVPGSIYSADCQCSWAEG